VLYWLGVPASNAEAQRRPDIVHDPRDICAQFLSCHIKPDCLVPQAISKPTPEGLIAFL
jgi:hypothetical protein